MAEFLSDLLAYGAPGFFQGFQAANQYRRQKAMDQFNQRMAQEALELRRATEERMQAENAERMRIARETERRQRAAAELKQFLAPAESIAKHPEVADSLAPAFQAAEQIEGAPEVTPAGAGVLAPGNAPPFGRDALRGARDSAVADAAEQLRQREDQRRQEEHDFRRAMLNEQIRARGEARQAALDARADTKDTAMAQRAAVLRPPEQKDLDSLSDALSLAQAIRAGKGGVDTGPVAAMLNSWAAKFGLDSARTTAFYASAKDQLSAYVRSISGTAASDKERAFLASVMPAPTDNDAQFMAKLDRFIGKTQEIRARRLQTLAKQGRDVSAYGEGAGAPAPAAPAGQPASMDAGGVGTVTLVLPDGRRKRVPRAAAEALSPAIPGSKVEP